jgi:hypothetical protein
VTEESHHFKDRFVDVFGEDALSGRDVVNDVLKSLSFDFLGVGFRERILKVENHVTLMYFLQKHLLPLVRPVLFSNRKK